MSFLITAGSINKVPNEMMNAVNIMVIFKTKIVPLISFLETQNMSTKKISAVERYLN